MCPTDHHQDGGHHDHDGSLHSHAHGHGHDHDHGHSHAHRGGIVGWLQHMYGHSHDVHEKVDHAMETHERGIWATKVSLVILGVTTLFQLAIVWLSGSTALLADTIHNFGDAATSIPLWIAFALVRRGRTRTFTYGLGRAEDVAGLFIVALIAFSMFVAGYESIDRIVNPEPITHLWWLVSAALIGFLGNEAVAVFRIRVGRQIGSAALVADGQHSRVDGFTSLAVLIGALGAWLGYPIIDPIIGLLITITIFFIVKDTAKSVFRRLLDGIEPEILAEVQHAPLHVHGVQDVHEARARWIGHKVHADFHVTVDPHLSVEESHKIVDRIHDALDEHVPAFGGATIHVCPGSPSASSLRGA